MKFTVVATCAKGHVGRVMLGYETRRQAEVFAALLDGSINPTVNRTIRAMNDPMMCVGRCAVPECGAFFDTTVLDGDVKAAPFARCGTCNVEHEGHCGDCRCEGCAIPDDDEPTPNMHKGRRTR